MLSKYVKKIVGERLFLAPASMNQEEIELYTIWMNDFSVTDYIARSSEVYTTNSEVDYLEKVTKDGETKFFNIVLNDGMRLIGTISLFKFNYINRSAHIGIFIGESDCRSKGYGTEAMRLLMEYGFKYLNLHTICLTCLASNDRAHKSYLKCGFKDTGLDREAIFLDGRYYDRIHMDILENEFDGGYIKNKRE